MWNLYDIAYGIGIGIGAPYWLIKPSARRKVLGAFSARMGREIPPRQGDEPAILIHAVSVGEMNATRALVEALRAARPALRFIISSTTETGYTRGLELYAPATDVSVVRYPLDFTPAIERVLDAIRPDMVVLMELEVWPNFVKRCQQRNIPVLLANARLTTSSYRNYRWGGALVKKMFRRLALVCAQDETYGVRFLELGVEHRRIVIAGTMKFDNASLAPASHNALGRAQAVGLRVGEEPIWVCGSTGPGEEELILQAYRKLLNRFARLRLVIVPRHPVRFDEVEQIIEDNKFHCERMSVAEGRWRGDLPLPPVVLIDAMGVLRDFYAIADVVFVGRSLVDLGPRQHGSDMIEPAALAKPVIVGPFTANFAEAVRKFRAGQAILEAPNVEQLEQAVSVMLSTPSEAIAMGKRAAAVVAREKGATKLHARVILQVLAAARGEETAPPAKMTAIPSGAFATPAGGFALPGARRPSVVITSTTPPPRGATPPAPPGKPQVIITSIGPAPTNNPFAQGDQKIEPKRK